MPRIGEQMKLLKLLLGLLMLPFHLIDDVLGMDDKTAGTVFVLMTFASVAGGVILGFWLGAGLGLAVAVACAVTGGLGGGIACILWMLLCDALEKKNRRKE